MLAGSAGEWSGGDQWGGQQRSRGREEKTTQKEIQASRQICKYDLYEGDIRGGGKNVQVVFKYLFKSQLQKGVGARGVMLPPLPPPKSYM
jgi:hypothetical protein